jgi:hypothetical protein
MKLCSREIAFRLGSEHREWLQQRQCLVELHMESAWMRVAAAGWPQSLEPALGRLSFVS